MNYDPHPSPQHRHYRNKLTLHTSRSEGETRLGYREERSHRVLEIPVCPLSCDPINATLRMIRSSGELNTLPDKASVTIRHTEADGTRWWVNRPPERSWLTETSVIGPLRVSTDGFFQVNPEVGQALTRTAMEWFAEQPTPELLDLYCGVGLFGLACMTRGGARLVGIESGKRAVLAARHNAAALKIPAEFHVRELGKSRLDLTHCLKDPSRTTCIIDPPRAGMERNLTQTLAHSGIPRILYISCDPATLQRDLKILMTEGGYRVNRVQLFDMFPRTAHFETIAEVIL